jgi:hypothetical protein
MLYCGQIITGISFLLTIGVFVTQIAFGVHYIHKPVKCKILAHVKKGKKISFSIIIMIKTN